MSSENAHERAMAWLDGLYQATDKIVASLLDRVQEEHGTKIACRGSGCHFCCYDATSTTPFELMGVVDAYNRLPEEKREIVSQQFEAKMTALRAEGVRSLIADGDTTREGEWDREAVSGFVEASVKHNAPCMFLDPETKGCMIYERRPFACRGHHSLDAEPELCDRRNRGEAATKFLDMIDVTMWFWDQLRGVGAKIVPYGEMHSMFNQFVNDDNPERENIQVMEE